MEKYLLHEKAIGILNKYYERIESLIVEGNRDLALVLYHSSGDILLFMYLMEIINFTEYRVLKDSYNDFFDLVFLR